MASTPEEQARQTIDDALQKAGWDVQDTSNVNVHAAKGVAIREFPLKSGYGTADYLLYINGKAAGALEAKKEGTTLSGVEIQTEKYSEGMPDELPAHVRPLPFLYQSTGVETYFTNRLDPEPRSRLIFHFHRPDILADWLQAEQQSDGNPSTLRGRLQHMPELQGKGLWYAQRTAVTHLEASFAEDRPRALIQMATGSGKTYAAITSIYRLIKYAKAHRVLFLVDRRNLGRQAHQEFQQYTTPDDGRKFTELYNVQHLTSNTIDPIAKVVITTIQRLYSMLRGDSEFEPDLEETSQFGTNAYLVDEPVGVVYEPRIPIEFFDFIFVDECHRSIYSLWRQVLEYFDAHIVGLTATPGKHTFGFFRRNLVMEYDHPHAVADGVNVDFEVYRIRTAISERGSTIEAGPLTVVGRRDRETREMRWEKPDEDITYTAKELDRSVVAVDQIQTVMQTFKEKLFTELFPGRTEVPKTLIYAKDDSHADDIVRIAREVFGKGNDFAQKITYRTGTARIVEKVVGPDGTEVEQVTYKSTGVKTDDLLSSFRNGYNPRIVVTVDMLATGTDIRPLEIIMFMREVKSRSFFEQMKGRGVRVIDTNELQAVTPDATTKTHFVIVDAVGVCENDLHDTTPLERQKSVSFDSLIQKVAFGSTDPDVLSSLASRLSRLDKRLTKSQQDTVTELTDGISLKDLASNMVNALDPDWCFEEGRNRYLQTEDTEPTEFQIKEAAETLVHEAVAPLANNATLRNHLTTLRKSFEQTIDEISADELLTAGFSEDAKERAQKITASFKEFLETHKDEITALQVLYSQPYAKRLTFRDIKELAEAIQAPPRSWTPEVLWRAYEALDRAKVRGASSKRLLTDIVTLVRFALGQENELVPFIDRVSERFQNWLAQQANQGRQFTDEQLDWLRLIRDHIASSMQIDMDDFDEVPFNQQGGRGKVYQLFGNELGPLLDELNKVLAA
jgi:type I restriction enzyme R subunit